VSTALVLLSSEQLWPSIHSLEHWKPVRVFVYTTSDERRSKEPARKLARFCRERFGWSEADARERFVTAEGAATPQAVYAQVRAWRDAHTAFCWVVNATGGTKPMFDGAAEMRTDPAVEVVYRELGPNDWFRLFRDATGPRSEPISVPADATAAIPVETLVRAIWPSGAMEVRFDPRPEPLALEPLTNELIARNGDWTAAFRTCGRSYPQMAAGPLFERYVAAGLIAMGVTNLAHSAKQVVVGTTKDLQEVDLVANFQSQLLVFDCKLRTEAEEGRDVEPLNVQIRNAKHTARSLGGLGCKVALVRPNRRLDEAARALAGALNVTVIDSTDVGTLFARLARFAGVQGLPELLRNIDACWSDSALRGKVFHAENAQVRAAARTAESPALLQLDTLLGEWAKEVGGDWAAVNLRAAKYALRYTGPASDDALRTALAPFAVGVVRVTGKNSRFVELETAPSGQPKHTALRAFFEARIQKPLID
jgi:hypothetical protein